MRLDRNVNPDGKGKYRLWDERKQAWVDDCSMGEEHEFFVIMLKDLHANPALHAYASSAILVDLEYGKEVRELANRSGADSPFCSDPD